MKYAKLVNKKPVECSMSECSELIENMDSRRVATYGFPDGTTVSTVFLGIDHSFGFGGPSLWFETMVFPHENDYTERYETWEQAEEGHARIVEMTKKDKGVG